MVGYFGRGFFSGRFRLLQSQYVNIQKHASALLSFQLAPTPICSVNWGNFSAGRVLSAKLGLTAREAEPTMVTSTRPSSHGTS